MTSYLIAIGIITTIYVLLSLGLSLQYGFTGILNFGHVGFFAIGAYVSALTSLHGLPVPAAMLLAGAAAAVCAWPIGLISLRLRGDYFAIVTLGFSETIRLALISEKWLTNGVHGVPGIPRVVSQPLLGMDVHLLTLTFLVAIAAMSAFMFHLIVKSPFGRLVRAVRDNEVAVVALGKSPTRLKVQVLAIGSFLAGLAGAFYAHYISYIVPDQFIPLTTFYVWIAIIVGGTTRVSGAVWGTLMLMVILEGSRFIRDVAPFVSDVHMASMRLGLVGVLLILFMLYRPQGITGKVSTS